MTPQRIDLTLGDEQVPAVATVVAKTHEIENVVTLKLELNERGGGPRKFVPGQFNMLYAFGVGEAAISVSDFPDSRGRVVHTIRNAGATSGALTRLKKGDKLGMRGPFGVGWPPVASGGNVIVMAGGLGLAPLRPLIKDLTQSRSNYGSVAVLYGVRTPDTILFQRDLRIWKEKYGIDVRITVDSAGPTWTGNVGLVTSLLDDLTVDRSTAAFVCGPEIMMRHSAESLCDTGISNDRIWLSIERNMKCAVGRCGHCQFGPAFVCKDGPVFRYDRIRSSIFVKEL